MGEGAAAQHTTHAWKDRNTRKWVHTSFFVMLNKIWLVTKGLVGPLQQFGWVGGGGETREPCGGRGGQGGLE